MHKVHVHALVTVEVFELYGPALIAPSLQYADIGVPPRDRPAPIIKPTTMTPPTIPTLEPPTMPPHIPPPPIELGDCPYQYVPVPFPDGQIPEPIEYVLKLLEEVVSNSPSVSM